MKYLILLLLLLAHLSVAGQKIYICELGEIQLVDVETFTTTTLCQLDNPQLYLNDIALDPSGMLYGMEVTKLYKIDPSTGATTLVHDFAPDNFVGLVADASGKLYLAGDRLFVFDPATNNAMDLGPLSEPCAGDLTFWNGDLYMAAVSGHILKINLQSPSMSSVYMNAITPMVGFVTIWDCVTGKTRTFGFGGWRAIEIDMSNKTSHLATNKILFAAGATSPWEWTTGLNLKPSIDTIVRQNPDCGMVNGLIEFVPSATELGKLEFSLDGQNWQSSGLFQPLPGGAYSVYIRGGACVNTLTRVVLNEKNTLTFHALPLSAAICTSPLGSVLVRPDSTVFGSTYSVDNGPAQADSVFTGLASGYHVFTNTAINGCKSYAYAFVADSNTAYIGPISQDPDSTSICSGVEVKLSTYSLDISTFTWEENGDTLAGENSAILMIPNTKPPGTYMYRAMLTDQYGCTATVLGPTVNIVDCTKLPNAFTPNGDGANDFFRLTGENPGKVYTLVIYDRWGQEVYKETSDDPQWDGTINGTPASSDVYVYKILTLGDAILRSGEVTLLR